MLRPRHLFMLLLPCLPGFAQTYPSDTKPTASEQPIRNRFDHLSVKDGLSTNSVNCILQDREGFMWFGTSEGLNKFDGHTFTVLKPDPENPAHSFQNSSIAGLCEDHANRLWAVTEGGGLHEVNKQTGQVTPHLIRASKANRWNNQHSVYEDRQGMLWVSTFAGLARYEPTRHHFTLYPAPESEAPIKTVFEDRQHRFWVGTLHGLYLLDRATGRFTPIPVPGVRGPQPTFISFYLDSNDTLWLGTATAGYSLFQLDLRRQPWRLVPYNPGGKLNSFVFMNSIHRDSRGILWVGTTNGLQAIDPVNQRVFTYRPDPNVSQGISSNNAQAVYHDRSGMIWVGTDNGIDRQAVATKSFGTEQVTPNKGTANLPENKVDALLLDHQGQLWLSNLYTVYRRADRQKRFEAIPAETLGSVGQHKNCVCAFLDNGPEGIWLGTWDGLYRFDQASGQYQLYPTQIPVQYIDRAPTGELWIGGAGGLASFDLRTHQYRYYTYKQTDTNGLPDKYVHGLLVSRTGDVWVLMKRQGLCRLHPRSGRFTRYTAGPKGHLNSNEVQAIYEDKAGIIWVGTHQGGLNRFDPRTGLFSAITNREGLPGNSVIGITSDRSGHLWVSTDKGLSRIDPYTNMVRSYEFSNNFVEKAVCRQQDRLFFGSLNGVVHFNPDSIRDDTRPFPVYITSLTVMDRPHPLTSKVITLPHDDNFLSFGFAALTYTQPPQHQYACQLVGVDKSWVQNGNRHVANYANLPPGTYTFRVKAANSDGIWKSTEASVDIVIQPPWWATWWAYSVYALLAGGAIWGYIWFYTSRIRQRQELELNRREAEQLKTVDELKTRFFANITHEFRTPLSLILSPVEKLLQDSRFDAPTRQTLTLMQRNANQLLRLINQLLDLTKVEAHQMPVSLMRGEVAAFVNQVVESFCAGAEQKGVALHYTVDGLPPGEHVFDADKWEKILTNLLSNALKFTGAGGQVQVSLRPVASAEVGEASAVQIRVADSGIGISPDNLPHIFDRFYQVDASRTRAYEGTGIGLALVRELIDLVRGTIHVESQQRVGTTFVVTLPIQPVSVYTEAPKVIIAPKNQISLASLPVAIPDLPRKSPIADEQAPLIVIVEDNDELREFLANELAATYRILRAVDGEAGWRLTQTEVPDIVISDVMMPRMDGYELTRLIKTHPDTDHIAVVILTAKAAHSSRIEGLREGADEYLSKPFHLDELYLRLRIFSRISRNSAIIIGSNSPSPICPAQLISWTMPFYSGCIHCWKTTSATRPSTSIG